MRSKYKRLGDYIKEVDLRNTKGELSTLLGINIDKYYMPSVANTVGTDLTAYKIVKRNQFACNRMHVGRDKRLPVAVSIINDDFIVSPAYNVFEIINENSLLPDYLMMWFSRKEFDRNAWFYTDADVRGGLSWEDFCNMQLPVPLPDKQREITKEYNIIVNRTALNNQIIKKLKETAQSIYKQWFIDFEFPDGDGKPYKNNGGEMVKSELGTIPKDWNTGCLFDLLELQRGFDLPTQARKEGPYPIYASTGITETHNEYKVKGPGIVTGRSGSLGEVLYIDEDFWPLNTTLWVKTFKNATPIFSFYVLKAINIIGYNSGSAVPTLNRNHIHLHQLIIPDLKIIQKFELIEKNLFAQIKLINKEQNALNRLREVLLSKLATRGN